MISFVEREGVYFVKMKILGAVIDEPADQEFWPAWRIDDW